jgi:hypothetical protein
MSDVWFELRWHDQHSDETPDYRRGVSLGITQDFSGVFYAQKAVEEALCMLDRAPAARVVVWRRRDAHEPEWADGCPRDGIAWATTPDPPEPVWEGVWADGVRPLPDRVGELERKFDLINQRAASVIKTLERRAETHSRRIETLKRHVDMLETSLPIPASDASPHDLWMGWDARFCSLFPEGPM